MTAPGDLRQYGSCTLSDDGCATCGDLAVPVRVVRLEGGDALVEDRTGARASVAVDLVPGVAEGDLLLVHMGVAIGRPPEGEPS
ncbi:MAG: HypC/HybG/HupF family hydrogenase formation chaperone [Planctomycetota bacterium]|jgi:hydrogenase expression/formation protein HypC